jgi:hypothetical protein
VFGVALSTTLGSNGLICTYLVDMESIFICEYKVEKHCSHVCSESYHQHRVLGLCLDVYDVYEPVFRCLCHNQTISTTYHGVDARRPHQTYTVACNHQVSLFILACNHQVSLFIFYISSVVLLSLALDMV